MARLHSPIHAGAIGSVTLRFFRSPSDEPDTPWIVVDDLARCLDFDQALRQLFHRGLQSDWASAVRTIATADGVVTIGPHFMAQGLLEAAVELNAAAQEVRDGYYRAGGRAMKVLTAGMTPRDRLVYSLMALG